MTKDIIQIGENFWNIRGSFKVGGVVNIGTHASLIRRANGKMIFLDSWSLTSAQRKLIDPLTHDGELVEAILNLHPFHTVHVRKMHEFYPNAALYGTSRHKEKDPDLPWQSLETDSPGLHQMFADDLEFTVPRGVDFISDNESIHFSSVLAYHRATKTIHSDDTLMCLKLPGLFRIVTGSATVSFHPTLANALKKRASAADEFQGWAEELIAQWGNAENLCAAHNSVLRAESLYRGSMQSELERALSKVQSTLRTHRKKYS